MRVGESVLNLVKQTGQTVDVPTYFVRALRCLCFALQCAARALLVAKNDAQEEHLCKHRVNMVAETVTFGKSISIDVKRID